ncbi:MAG: divalent-cation tolerance protein CutA [Maricaulaceae bacterium]|nr:divalent-cation tolerance protein CutA [Maricaulaceae bacterium]
MSGTRLIYTTWPDRQSAEDAARILVDERLCACANILGVITSVYRWEGTVETAQEVAAVFKTASAAALCARILALHPYDVPAVLALPVDADGSAQGFLDWIAAETKA